MTEKNVNINNADEISTTDESVTTQTLADSTESITNAGEPTASVDDAHVEPTAPSPVCLPAGYLASGYYDHTSNGIEYLRPEFVGEYAETMAKLLASMKFSDFNALLKILKRSKKSTLPFEARLTAALETLPKAMMFVHRKKAPLLLVTFIKHNIDNILDDDDWDAFYRHMEAIAAYMVAEI